MKRIVFLLVVIISVSCGQGKKTLSGETVFQKKMNSEFKDATTSPLKSKDLKTFEGLDFFEHDSVFIVNANLKLTPDTEFFKMKTTTSRVSEERVFGLLSFELKGQEFKLNIYQGKENMETKGYEDYLFLPFLDNTNGESTYGGGRYIDLRIPEGNMIEIDFNTAYNPYCTYNEKYSCPIVPRDNYISIKVEAGVKAFKKY